MNESTKHGIISSIKGSKNSSIVMVSTIIDVTESSLNSRKLKKEQAIMKSIIKNMPKIEKIYRDISYFKV